MKTSEQKRPCIVNVSGCSLTVWVLEDDAAVLVSELKVAVTEDQCRGELSE